MAPAGAIPALGRIPTVSIRITGIRTCASVALASPEGTHLVALQY